MQRFLLSTILSALFSATALAQDYKTTDLGDGYVQMKTETYEIHIPKGWKVSPETFFGQRKASPEQGKGELGMMTAPPSRQNWDQLYKTALYYIMREADGQASPYKLTKTKNGYEAATFEVIASNGFNSRRYVMIKHQTYGLLALSVTIPDKESDKQWTKHFSRMVDTARFLGD